RFEQAHARADVVGAIDPRWLVAGGGAYGVEPRSGRDDPGLGRGAIVRRDRGPGLGDLDERTVERDRLAHERIGPAPEPALRGGEARALLVDPAERRIGAAQPAEAQRRRASVARLAKDPKRALVRLAGGAEPTLFVLE